ncbi:MAG: hypothetical protein QM740_13995 [Acidovorax sp.]
MKTIAYLTYGAKREYQLELTYSVLSAQHHLAKDPSGIRIVLVTTESNVRNDLPVEHLVVTQQQLREWQEGGYGHAAKYWALLAVMDRFQGAVAFVDTDTQFLHHPQRMFDRVGPNMSVMQADEGVLAQHTYWQPLLDKLDGPVHGYNVHAGSRMFNSGVIGVDYSMRSCMPEVLQLMSLYEIAPVFDIEQFAFTAVLEKHGKLSACPDVVKHYWGHERRFFHLQINALFPEFNREQFNSHVEAFPPAGYPPKSMVARIKAKIKRLQRDGGRDYEFAYLAYLCALSSEDAGSANVWADIALDALRGISSPPLDAMRIDFRMVGPASLASLSWMSLETRERWQGFWRALPSH